MSHFDHHTVGTGHRQQQRSSHAKGLEKGTTPDAKTTRKANRIPNHMESLSPFSLSARNRPHRIVRMQILVLKIAYLWYSLLFFACWVWVCEGVLGLGLGL